MGNATSSGSRGHHDESVDYGALVPQGVYTGLRDWNHPVVSQFIIARKLAPFYRPLEDYEDSWDDEQILAARKDLPGPENSDHPSRSESTHSLSSSKSKRSPAPPKDQPRPDAAVYRGAVECPICFLYYPPNINHSRCCDQAICTECFVQIKRNEPTTTHIVSEPAACPYCVQDNFGIVYRPPLWRAGIGSEGSTSQWPEPPREPQAPAHKRRQKSYSADSPEVVTTDQIRPDWEAKLAAVRAAVARRANRRIIMRQVGDRLIPVGVTSGRVHSLTPEEAAAEAAEGGGSRRRRRHAGNSQLEQYMSIPGQDLEELMLMEAMRLSLIEHEEQQRKEAEEKRKQEAAAAAAAGNTTEGAASNGDSQTTAAPGPPTLETRLATQTSNSSFPSSSQASTTLASALPASRQSQESSDTGQRTSRSNSRSRPSPPHESGDGDSTPSWNHRSPNPPPFSALNAALVSASTATAILGPSSRASQENRATTDSPLHHAVASSASDTSAHPIITVARNECIQNLNHAHSRAASSSNDNAEHDSEDENERPPLPPKVTVPTINTTTASLSSLSFRDGSGTDLNDTSSNYGHLPSSPDSDIINEPLLGGSSHRKLGLGAATESEHGGSPSNGIGVTPLPDDDRSISMRSGISEL